MCLNSFDQNFFSRLTFHNFQPWFGNGWTAGKNHSHQHFCPFNSQSLSEITPKLDGKPADALKINTPVKMGLKSFLQYFDLPQFPSLIWKRADVWKITCSALSKQTLKCVWCVSTIATGWPHDFNGFSKQYVTFIDIGQTWVSVSQKYQMLWSLLVDSPHFHFVYIPSSNFMNKGFNTGASLERLYLLVETLWLPHNFLLGSDKNRNYYTKKERPSFETFLQFFINIFFLILLLHWIWGKVRVDTDTKRYFLFWGEKEGIIGTFSPCRRGWGGGGEVLIINLAKLQNITCT